MNEMHEHFADLALGLLQGTLSGEDKAIVQKLILENRAFREILKGEIAIKSEMESLRETIPPEVARRVYVEITASSRQVLFNEVSGWMFATFLPAVLQPLSKLFQRSVLVSEQ